MKEGDQGNGPKVRPSTGARDALNEVEGRRPERAKVGPNDAWHARLSEYLDGDLTPTERQQLDAHLAGCPTCAAALDGLQAVVARAGGLRVPSQPSEDLWPGIGSRLQPRRTGPVLPLAPRRRLTPSMRWLAAAAALAFACLATLAWLLHSGRGVPASQGAGTPGGTPAVEGPTQPSGADRKYDDTVAELRRVVRENLTHDPQVVGVVEKNLAALDQAISEYQDALTAQPGDEILTRRLAEARERKLSLLQQTATLADLSADGTPREERQP